MEQQIIEFLLNPNLIPAPYFQIISGLRIIFIILTTLLFSLIVYILISSNWLKYRAVQDMDEFVKFKSYGSDKHAKEWKKIMKRLDSGIEAEFKLALIEADTMLENILRQVGYGEETIEKNLNKITSIEISNIEELKEIRRIRNAVVYDPDYQLSKEKVREVMEIYQESFRSLGVV